MRSPFLEDLPLKPLPTMTLATALQHLNDAGYQAPFANVTLRHPPGPSFTEPLHIFGIFGFEEEDEPPFVAVGTVTGMVMPIT